MPLPIFKCELLNFIYGIIILSVFSMLKKGTYIDFNLKCWNSPF